MRGAAVRGKTDAVSIRHAAEWRMGIGRQAAAPRAGIKTENRSHPTANQGGSCAANETRAARRTDGIFI